MANSQEHYGSFDWIVEYEQLKDFLTPAKLGFGKDCKILIVGCGTSTLSYDLAQAGFRQIVSCDIDRPQVELMQERHADLGPDIRWVAADMTNASDVFPDGAMFDVAIDKGTLDALLCTDQASELVCEMFRLLKEAGLYVIVSFRSKDFILKLLDLPGKPFMISSEQVPLQNSEIIAHIYYCRKQSTSIDLPAVRKYQDASIEWWHREQEPLLTPRREKAIRARFNSKLESCATTDPPGTLDLETCHLVLFEEEERDEYGYDLASFKMDVVAFSTTLAEQGRMNIEQALQFLSEMQ